RGPGAGPRQPGRPGRPGRPGPARRPPRRGDRAAPPGRDQPRGPGPPAHPRSRFAPPAAQAAAGQPDPALSTLLAAVREGPGETRDRARELMLDVFRLLGDGPPLTAIYRKNLTRAVF